ncbi:MAG: BON domain-containing protein [Pseudomonadota bacterium]
MTFAGSMRPVAGVVLALVLAAGCQAYRDGERRTIGEFTDDTAIQSRVKLALFNDDALSGWGIDTDVHQGVVSLLGKVGSRDARRRADELARAVKGVRDVDNQLEVSGD